MAGTTGRETANRGVFVRGVLVGSTARAFRKKEGKGLDVRVSHEIATTPGVVLWHEYFSDDSLGVDVREREGRFEVVEFPRPAEEFAPLVLRAERFKMEDGGRLVVTSGRLVGEVAS